MLSDRDLMEYIKLGWLKINPLYEDSIQQNGVDMRIGEEIALPKQGGIYDIKSSKAEDFFSVKRIPDEGIVIEPMTSFLLHTEERITLPPDVMAICGIRSTIARMGFIAPVTYVDAGFDGQLTIELFWSKNYPVRIYKGIRFLHVVFSKTTGVVLRPYTGVYQGQSGVRLPKPLGDEKK
ncbi:MAG: dCTP deaminase [Thermoproteota archaeon]|jgi:dCTP deaminase|uniref:dCTP deaminase n=1 Tax=Candidatus Methanodesulfokora washburnensis TaxID=2478471 RepID=A0A429GV71_9CREN|nr:dCTP deaminase [Candidatus Methanodesulfokores washburnensis]RSN77764.1 dCTP deaminase [Candidatus Methanodesulfokores washburnensis]RZN58304.1 MAG: dCTP deaminase [Candidatus Methanodesulfokores washburnensis]TDA41158.1 MAG: dCTP deaminase [Candidatus Korarchaeota archaeon]